jgi:SulP family sulfate permease
VRIFNVLRLETLRGDLFGGVTAAVVALPLALAFGVASGAGAMAGLYGAIAVGFFAALFGGTPAQVSGPTGPMTVVFAAVVSLYAENLAQAFTIVMLGGLFQIAFGYARLGRYVQYTPASVVSGFMSGIGVIIILVQLAPLIGAPGSSNPMTAVAGLPEAIGLANLDAVGVGALALAAMLAWPKRLRGWTPPPLVALVVATLAAVFFFTDAPRIGEIPQGLPPLTSPIFTLAQIPVIVTAALTLALLGSIDSLLTSLIADSITRTQHDSDQELVGQGIGNFFSGLIGGLPGAGATMRTVVNVRAGGMSGTSGMVHAVVLLAVVLGLGPLAAQIPLAALAGILLKVGWDIIDWGFLKRLYRAPREKAAVMLATLILTVGVDLITAVAVGLIMAGFVNARARAVEELEGLKHNGAGGVSDLSAEEQSIIAGAAGRVRVTSLAGTFSFASARELARRIAPLPGEVVVLDLSGLKRADLTAALAIEEIVNNSLHHARALFVVVSGPTAASLDRLKVLAQVPTGRRFAERGPALTAAAAFT